MLTDFCVMKPQPFRVSSAEPITLRPNALASIRSTPAFTRAALTVTYIDIPYAASHTSAYTEAFGRHERRGRCHQSEVTITYHD